MVVVIVAFVEMLLRLAEVVYAPFYALFLVGPAALLIEMWVSRPFAWTQPSAAPSTRHKAPGTIS